MKNLVIIILLFLFIPVIVNAQSPNSGHRIVYLNELVRDATIATWKDESGTDISFNQRSSGWASVLRNLKEGLARAVKLPNLPTPLDKLSPQERAQALARYQSSQPVRVPSLDIEFNSQGNQDQAVRGAYQITLLTDMLCIQLEVDYDIQLVNKNQ